MDILLKFVSLDKIIITSSESIFLVRLGEGLITSLGLNFKARPKRYKNSRYAIRNVSKKEILKIMRNFDKLPFQSYQRRRNKHEPNVSYFYLARQLEQCLMRTNELNSHVYPVSTKIYRRPNVRTRTNQKAPLSTNVLQRKTIQNALTKILTNKKRQIMRQSWRNHQLQMKCRSILTYSRLVRNIFIILEVTYEQACMDTTKDKYLEKMLETLVTKNYRQNSPFVQ